MIDNIISAVDNIIAEATISATNLLRLYGEFDPYSEIECGDASYTIQAAVADSDEKTIFANQIRAMAVLHRAHAVTIVTEAWASLPDWKSAPSLDPNRTEVVMILVETPFVHAHTNLRIERDGAGGFTALSSHETHVEAGPSQGSSRFDQLLAPRNLQNSPTVRAAAETFLKQHPLQQAPLGSLPGLGGSVWGNA
jgi:hypothetical protein